MGLLDRIFNKKKAEPPKNAPTVKLAERRSDPGIVGRSDFGGTVCGFDLSNECYSKHGTIVLTEGNWRKAMDDFLSLERLFRQAGDYDKTFPTMLKTSIYDALPTAELHGPTPTGRKSKYTMTVRFVADEPTVEPEDWDEWIDQYAESDAGTRKAMSDALDVGYTDSIIGSIRYLQSGGIGSADFNFFSEGVVWSIAIRSKGGPLFLSQSSRGRIGDSKKTVTYRAGRALTEETR